MFQRSFQACGITTITPGLVHNDDFFKKIMAIVEEGSDQTADGYELLWFKLLIQYTTVTNGH